MNKNITDQIYWFLDTSKPFVINDEYEIKLEYIDHKRQKVKILIKNIKKQTEDNNDNK